MSTRCQIEFTSKYESNKGKVVTETRTIYRHSDGYPEGVIPDLKEFIKWNESRMGDVEYTTANFVYWSKAQNVAMFKKHKFNIKDAELTGFGFCLNGEYHGDIEYLYKVITENGKTEIEIYETRLESGKQTFKRIYPRIKKEKVN